MIDGYIASNDIRHAIVAPGSGEGNIFANEFVNMVDDLAKGKI